MGANDEHMRHRTGMEGDPVTDIVTLASARCVEVGTLVAGGSWALRFPPPQKIKFVAVVKGACWLTVEGEVADLRIETGDVFVLPAQRSFVRAGDLNAPQSMGSEFSLMRSTRQPRSAMEKTSSPLEHTSLWTPSAAECSRRCYQPCFTFAEARPKHRRCSGFSTSSPRRLPLTGRVRR